MWNEEEEEWIVVDAEEHVDPENYVPHLQSRRLLRRQSSLGMSHSLAVPCYSYGLYSYGLYSYGLRRQSSLGMSHSLAVPSFKPLWPR